MTTLERKRCPAGGKVCHTSKKAALRQSRSCGGKLRAWLCKACRYWHVSGKNNERYR